MKKIKYLLLFTVLLISSTSFAQNWWKNAIRGEGEIVSQNLDLAEIESVTLAFSGDVILTQGNTQSVRVEAQQNIIDNIVTNVDGRHWKIKYDRPVRNSKGVKVYITMKTLRAAKVSGSGNITSKNTFTNLGNVNVAVSGSGDVNLAMDAEGDVSSRISGSGTIRLGGRAGSIDVGISGSGDVRAYDLAVARGDIQISGSGDAEVNVTGELEIKISGSGDVTYKGKPRMRSKVSGSGDVNSY